MIAGDTLSLDSSDFYVVVDGSMQVYAQIRQFRKCYRKAFAELCSGTGGNATFPSDPLDDDGDNNGFQLLNEVESGGTLSSLFTILRLFT